MARVVCFGEVMLRLTPPEHERIVQSTSFGVSFGGAESNVAISLSRLGVSSAMVTRVPDNPVGDACLSELRRHGVGTQHVMQGGERLGIYFLEPGASARATRVTYDRKASAFATMQPGQIDWDACLREAEWFHFSGITPSLSEGAALLARDACRIAKQRGLTVSCDLNYRAALWTPEAAGASMAPLLDFVDVLVANEEHASLLFGIQKGQGLEALAQELIRRFDLKSVILTMRDGASASDNQIGAAYYDGSALYQSRVYDIHIVDRVGAGDALMAGFVAASLRGLPPQTAIEYAVAASALKHTIPGDVNLASHAEVLALASGQSPGRVQR